MPALVPFVFGLLVVGIWFYFGYVAFRRTWADIGERFPWSVTAAHRRAELGRCLLFGPMTLLATRKARQSAKAKATQIAPLV